MVCFDRERHEMACSCRFGLATYSGSGCGDEQLDLAAGVGGEKCISRVALPRPGGIRMKRFAFRTATSEIRNPDGSVVFAGRGNRGAGRVEPGRLRHPRAEILPQGRRACASGAGCGTGPSALAVAAHRRSKAASRGAGRERPPRRRNQRQAGLRPAWPAPGPIGAGRAAISTPRRTPAPSTTRSG